MVAKKDKITVICNACGKPFDVQPYRVSANARFCGRACYRLWRSGKTFSRTIPVSGEELIRQYNGGMTLAQIAEQYNVTLQAIAYHLKKANAPTRKPTGDHLHTPDAIEKMRQANSGRHSHNYRELPIEEISAAYAAGDSATIIARRYSITANAILQRLRAANVQMRPKGYTKLILECADGHIVRSKWEQIVDDWLSGHDISHEVQPPCPWLKWPSMPLGDFRAGDTFIEVWGIEGNAKYDRQRLDKIAKYREYDVKLIEIFPHHILDQDFTPLHALLPSP